MALVKTFSNIQPVDIHFGRYVSPSEFQQGSNSAVIGNEIAEQLFIKPGKSSW